MTKQSIGKNQISSNELSRKRSLQERGITLIALVVTIIILLILAGVTLNMALSQDGLFSKTQEAADKYKQAQEDEEFEIEKIEYAAEGKDIKEVKEISTLEEFKSFRDDVNKGDKSFENTLIKLTDDLDLSDEEPWTPIGTSTNPFNGAFNGNGHEIKNLSFGDTNEGTCLGLFGYNVGIIKNIGVAIGNTNCELTNASAIVGFISGSNSGTIEKCYNKMNGTFEGGHRIAGIVGELNGNGRISECYNEGVLTFSPTGTSGTVCGLAGYVRGGAEISLCFNKGNLTVYETAHNSMACGIADGHSNIISCYNVGNIKATKENCDTIQDWPVASGIIGQTNYGKSLIANCYSIGEVELISNATHKRRIGGVVGLLANNGTEVKNNHFWIDGDLNGIGENYNNEDDYDGKINGYESKDKLKKIAELLGNDYKSDTNNKNEGFPILVWQEK